MGKVYSEKGKSEKTEYPVLFQEEMQPEVKEWCTEMNTISEEGV
jgi:hypothetical protein